MPTCTRHAGATGIGVHSHFPNEPFTHRRLHPARRTRPAPPRGLRAQRRAEGHAGEPGGCTRDLVHRFYQEQYQLDGGKQDRYVTGSDAVGLTMGDYDTKALPIYRYLHSKGAPKYVIADRFFQAAFGGSFLNHQWLIAARTPLDTSDGADGAKHSVLDTNGMPTDLPAVHRRPATRRRRPADRRSAPAPPPTTTRPACGDFAVNTVQPSSPPTRPRGA